MKVSHPKAWFGGERLSGIGKTVCLALALSAGSAAVPCFAADMIIQPAPVPEAPVVMMPAAHVPWWDRMEERHYPWWAHRRLDDGCDHHLSTCQPVRREIARVPVRALY